MRLFPSLLALLFVLSACPAYAADNAPVPPQERHHTAARLVSAVAGTGNLDRLPVALGLRLEKGWKTYWRTPGEAGLAPVFDWKGSLNLKSALPRFPAPRRYTAEELDNYVYQDSLILPFDVIPVETGKPVSLKLKLDLLVCNRICLPETWNLALDIPAGQARQTEAAASFVRVLKSLPRRDDAAFVRAYLNYDSSNTNYLVVEIKADVRPASGADLFVEHGSGLNFGRPSIAFDSRTRRAVFTAPVHSPEPLDKIAAMLSGSPLVLTWANNGVSAITRDSGDAASPAVWGMLDLSPRPDAQAPVSQQAYRTPAVASKAASGIQIALIAFLGGLILNLMPCVLPVLSLKILSVLSHGGKNQGQKGRNDIFNNFSASAFGILITFWLMAGTLAALKATGQAVGWGIQFQNPVFLSFLIVIVLIFAANMWGLFDIPLPRFIARNIPARHEHEPTLVGHFMSGVFATLLATPCTAPFLGTAVGFALARSAPEIFSVFSMIGLGFAAPYLLLAVSPGLFRFLPKPGQWMVTLKKVLSLALVLTALWLASVLFAITSTPALDEGWQPFDETLIAPAVKEGKVVIVDITADWCLTCKANKRLVLEQDDVVEALSGPEILRLQADWTQRDANISAFMEKYGRYGIPFDIVYGSAAPEGIPLPELLSKKAILDAVAEAAGE